MMRGGASAPVFVINQQTQREQGSKVQLQNIQAAKVALNLMILT